MSGDSSGVWWGVSGDGSGVFGVVVAGVGECVFCEDFAGVFVDDDGVVVVGEDEDGLVFVCASDSEVSDFSCPA